MRRGRELFDDVRQCREAAFWWLGQHTFVVRLGEACLLFDPFLSPLPERNVPPLFAPADAAGVVDLVLCTHDHLDHLDPEAIPGLARDTAAHFVAPRAHAARLRGLGVLPERFTGLDDGEAAEVAGVTVHAVKAAHEFFDRTAEGLHPHLGFVVEGAGKTVYHAGDTLWWEGLQARLSRWRLDLALVPINGRDARRYADDVMGNMTFQEAADLLGGLEVGLAVPAHYDMFDFNAEDPQRFVDYVAVKYPGRRVWAGPHTERVPF